MADEIEFINSRGETTYLPESVGDSMGLKRASDFVPPESITQQNLEHGVGTSAALSNAGKPTFGQAVALLREFMDTATDEEKQPERMDDLADLGTDLMKYTGHLEIVDGQQEQTGGPSLVDAIAAIEAQLQVDKTKTPKQKEMILKHLQDVLDAASATGGTTPTDTPPAE